VKVTALSLREPVKKEKAGFLQRKQQIEKLTADVVTFEKEYSSVVSEKDICIINRDEAKWLLLK
jgi:hypothetical protein